MPETLGAELAMRVLREGLLLGLLVAAPFLLATLVTGVITGLLQAVTQVHDHVVGFVPRVLVTLLALVILGPSLGAQVVRFAAAVFAAVGTVR